MRGVLVLLAAVLLTGCASAGPATSSDQAAGLTGKALEAQQCQRGGGWWRSNLGVCDWQGTGTGKI
jgi:hypothetical protein